LEPQIEHQSKLEKSTTCLRFDKPIVRVTLGSAKNRVIFLTAAVAVICH